jgi:hypothetical protein
VELKAAPLTGSNIAITGRTGCSADNLQTVTVTYYVCAY